MRRQPFPYNEEIGQEICHQIATTSYGLKVLCKLNKHWPSRAHIYTWMLDNPSFKDLYLRAKQSQIEALVDDIVEIADNKDADYIQDDKGRIVVDHEHINRSKLRVDTRKWLAARLCPRLYGSKNNEDSNDGSYLEKNIDNL